MNRLSDLREENDLKQIDVAKFLKIARNSYSQYETETRDVGVNTLIKLSSFYNTSIDYILYRTDNRNPYLKSKFLFNNNLKVLRKSYNKTQKEISNDLNLPLKTYIKYENGTIGLSTNLLNIFADYYKTSTDYIVGSTIISTPFNPSKVDWNLK